MKLHQKKSKEIPPGGGACYWCDGQLYRNSKTKEWTYLEIEDNGYTRSVHVHQCGGPNGESVFKDRVEYLKGELK